MNEVADIEVYEWREGEPRLLRRSHLVARLATPTNGQAPQKGDRITLPVFRAPGEWPPKTYIVLDRELTWLKPFHDGDVNPWSKMWILVREVDDPT